MEGVVRYVSSLQQPDGSFFGDQWGEVDNRFSFCAVACLALLGRFPFSSTWMRSGMWMRSILIGTD